MSQQYPNRAIMEETFRKLIGIFFTIPFRTTKETKLHWLQLQIIHRIIPYNNFVFKIKVKDSPICSFCKDDLETKEHIFADCNIVKEVWSNIEEI